MKKLSKLSLAKLGAKNPMYGKKLTKEHRQKIAQGIKNYCLKNPDFRKNHVNHGNKHHSWLGDKVGYHGIHDWIERKKGKALKFSCRYKDKTCKGKME